MSTVETLDQKVTIRIVEILDSIREGGGDEPGVGPAQSDGYSRSISMTAATECYWGTSGRGNPNAKRKILAASNFGYLRVVGKKQLKVSITPARTFLRALSTSGCLS